MTINIKKDKFALQILMLCGHLGHMARIRRLATILCCGLIISCTTIEPSFSRAEVASLDRLLLLMRSRLDLAQDVAKNKWNTKSAIEDLPREKIIIDGLAVQAAQHGLVGPKIKRFFRAQIEGSKILQTTLFVQWEVAGQKNFSGMPDLAKDIRPVLDKMTPDMLILLKDVFPVLTKTGADRLVMQHARLLVPATPDFEKAWQISIEPLLESGK